ncbi:MAG: manganese efflux pump MntP family protein [bacterium]|nr:manganese efflux pump MntP family protein [bacterium]
MLTYILIAFGLAMDAFAVSITSGAIIKNVKPVDALKIALFFGMFQMGMPLIGWFVGSYLDRFISSFDHWVAFGLLSLIGIKMIHEATKKESEKKEINPLNLYVLLLLSVATSIDALAVGLSFAFLRVPIITPIMIIGIITFSLSFIGVFIGNKAGHFFENKIEILGGIILIAIGLKILIQHLI